MNKHKKVNLYKDLYSENDEYHRNLIPMYRLIKSCINFDFTSFLDYGCGKSNLAEIFKVKKNIKSYKYDPAIPEYSKIEKNLQVDLIANCDVMEHIPEDEIDTLLIEMSNISKNVFFNIYLKEAETILPNGENAHCTVKPIKWWKEKILDHFDYANVVFTSYKNSVCIITWKIGNYHKLINFYYYAINAFEHMIFKFKNILKWK